MPVVLVPIHFDRDPANRIPSCARSVVLRPFLTNDFMTGVPIVPGSDILPTTVILPNQFYYVLSTTLIESILCCLTGCR